MGQVHDGLPLAAQLRQGLRLDRQMLPQHLQGDDAAPDRVPRLEDLADGALPQRVEDLVRPDGQIGPPALEQEALLVGGQPVDLDEIVGQFQGVRVMGR